MWSLEVINAVNVLEEPDDWCPGGPRVGDKTWAVAGLVAKALIKAIEDGDEKEKECPRCGLWMRHTHPCLGSTLSEEEDICDCMDCEIAGEPTH